MDKKDKMFRIALKQLTHTQFRHWLCFVYGVMQEKMTKRDLEMFRQHLTSKR